MDDDIIVSSTEIIKDKLYFATLEGKHYLRSTKNSKYFHIEDTFVYENFYNDFGPYHLCHLYLFCKKLNTLLSNVSHNGKVVFYTSAVSSLRLNAAYLIGSYAIIYLKKSPIYIHNVLTNGWDPPSFRDASGGFAIFQISLLDVLQGVHKAYESKFFDFTSFNHSEYQFYEKVINGDLNWIIPGKMLAFSGPHSVSQIKDGYPLHAPDHYHKYFNENNVTTIVRLNKKMYSAKQFTDFGFEHFELFFVDGSSPSDSIVNRFIKICENTKGAVAVHCKAGLGRTGTLIACYMMKHYAFMARQAIAWLRICRPGSVIGDQQRFLENVQSRMLFEGDFYRKKMNIYSIPKCKYGVYSLHERSNLNSSLSDEDVENANVPESNAIPGSGDVCNGSVDNVENEPKHAVCRIVKLNDEIQSLPMKQSKEDFVSLDSIINSNVPSMETRSSSQQRVRNNSALATAKTAYTSNKSNYIISTTNSVKPAGLVKVQTTYATKKLQANVSSSVPKSPTYGSSKSATALPIKSAVKGQHSKSALHSQRANLARNHGQGFVFNNTNPLKTYTRKAGSLKAKLNPDNLVDVNSASSITTLTESCSLSNKKFDSNLNITVESTRRSAVCNTNSLPTKLGDSTCGCRKKSVTRTSSVIRKKAQKTGSTDQNHDFRIENPVNSNSDSERDSTNTTITNISADSLENIPFKMSTRCDKSQSPEPMDQSLDNIDEGVNSQGTKLYKIKAKRLQGFSSKLQIKKEGVVTRSLSISPSAKKK